MTKAELHAFMTSCRLAVLASTFESMPQAALVGVAVTRDFEIVFDTLASTRKYRNLMAIPKCAFCLGWSGEKTVQYEGTAEQLRLPEMEKALAAYYEAWPDGPGRAHWPGLVYVVVRPRWIRFSDYDQSPPFVQEFSFAA